MGPSVEIRNQRRDVIGEERKVTIARWHNTTDLELEPFKTRDGIFKEGSCRRKSLTESISFSKVVQVAPNVEMIQTKRFWSPLS
jgi:hypothetical protein